MCQANFVGSKSPHPRRPVASVLNVTRYPSIPSSNGFTFPGLQAQSPAGEAYGRSVIEPKLQCGGLFVLPSSCNTRATILHPADSF
jgi:hypothetical protein